MKPPAHALASVAIGGAIWRATGEPLALPVALATGFLVDVDHLPDLYWTLVLRRSRRVVLALHAYEWLLVGLLVALLRGWDPLSLSALLAYGAHLLGDQVWNRFTIPAYFFTFRAWHRFSDQWVHNPWYDEEELLLSLPLGRRLVPPLLSSLRRLHGTEGVRPPLCDTRRLRAGPPR